MKSRTLFLFIVMATLFSSSFFSTDAGAISTNPTPTCSANCTVNFSYTGDFYSWAVPTGVSSIIVDAFGAQGGKSSCAYNTVASGGFGGRVQARIATTAGETLYLYVGGQGSSASISSNISSAGWNGGGKGGYGTGSGYWGSGGGGATDIRTSAGSLATRILVAGGGGGAACRSTSTADSGGAGGGLTGGESPQVATGSTASNGGTQSAGGAGHTWSGWGPSEAGSLGVGGNSQATDVTSNQSLISGGGGGGGGYFGGGGGSWVGGAGGSSYTDAIRSSFVTHSQGSRSGSGLLTFTYTVELPVITASVNGNANIVKKGEQIQITANVDQAGKVTFFANGKRIVGCTAISAVAGNVVCNWKPTVQGSTSITASIYQNGVLRSTSAALILGTARRAGFR